TRGLGRMQPLACVAQGSPVTFVFRCVSITKYRYLTYVPDLKARPDAFVITRRGSPHSSKRDGYSRNHLPVLVPGSVPKVHEAVMNIVQILRRLYYIGILGLSLES